MLGNISPTAGAVVFSSMVASRISYSIPVIIILTSASNALLLELLIIPDIPGTAIANIIAKITITANNSTNVNPFLFFNMLILLSCHKYITTL